MRHRSNNVLFLKRIFNLNFFIVCIANVAMSCSQAQEASPCYWERAQEPFESICLLCCRQLFVTHRYVLSICFLACFGSPGLSGKGSPPCPWLGGIKWTWSGPVPNSASLGPPPRSQLPCSNRQQEMLMSMHTAARTPTHTQLTQLSLAPRHNTVQPRLSFRHRACYRVIALLINVSPSQDNGLVFTVRFSRLATRDIQ